MAMPNCRACGGMLMETWDSCRFCGAALDTTLGSNAPAPVLRSDQPSRVPLLLAAAVAVLVAVGVFLFLRSGGEPEEAPAAPEADRTVEEFEQDNLTALTTPSATRDDYAIAVAALGPKFGVPAESWGCVAGGAVDALGGPEALRVQGVTPQEFAVGDIWDDLEVPAGAVQRLTDAFYMCSVNMVDSVINEMAAQSPNDADLYECMRGGVDRGLVNRAVAEEILGVSTSLVPGSEFEQHLAAVAQSCV